MTKKKKMMMIMMTMMKKPSNNNNNDDNNNNNNNNRTRAHTHTYTLAVWLRRPVIFFFGHSPAQHGGAG